MTTADLVVRRARLEGAAELADIAVAGGRIAAVAPALDAAAAVELDAAGRVVVPAFVEPHIHLDKVGVAALLPPNRSGTLAEAIELLHRTKRAATADEIAERAGAVIRQAVAAGTTVVRTHVDVDTIGGLTPITGVRRAAQQHADLCDVQIVAFPQEGIERDPGTAELMARAMDEGADVVGGMPHWEADRDAAERHVELCLQLAVRHDADVDMHVDETDDPDSRTLELLAEATARHGWGGRVTAGHCCAMAAWEDPYAARVIAQLAAVGVNVIANPATNLLLQGRLDHEPRRRGIARVKELLDAGVTVASGQDCVQDTFYPFGAADQLQVALILAHAAQLSTPDEIQAALAAVGSAAARVVRRDGYGIFAGARGDLLVLDAESMPEALRRQVPRRWVIRAGRVVAETEQRQTLHRE
jgi:cytosine/creatinine deaminase